MQAILFKDDTTNSKPMIKYASNISKESVVDVEAIVRPVNTKVEGCTQSEVSLPLQSCLIHCRLQSNSSSELMMKCKEEKLQTLS